MKVWLRLLIHIYPKAFRERFGDELFEIALAKAANSWLRVSIDLAVNGCKERWDAADRTAAFLVPAAIVAGLWIALADLRASEVQGVVLVLLIVSAAFGAARPKKAWAWACILGSGIFLVHEARALMGLPATYKVEPNDLALLLPLIPAFIGAYVGACLRAFRDISLEP